jgi:membrane-associated phospholipid phosphatase
MRTNHLFRRTGGAALVFAAVFGAAAPALAQRGGSTTRSTCGDAPSVRTVAKDTVNDFGRFFSSPGSVGALALGGVAALGVHPVDGDVTRDFTGMNVDRAFQPGAVIGSTPFQLGASIAVYGLGRALGHSCAATVGADLIQAQLMSEGLTFIVKEATRRSRPEGSGFSFPSGHTTISFASATVLQRHFGWKVGLPAYAVATYVAASRVEMKKHYLSDVTFGAVLGITAGRTVSIGSGRHLFVSPIASEWGPAVGVTLIGAK